MRYTPLLTLNNSSVVTSLPAFCRSVFMFVIGVSNTVYDKDYNNTSIAINSSKAIVLPVKGVAILSCMSKACSL